MKKLTTNEFIERSLKIHKNKYNYSKVNYINNNTKIWIICPIHGKFLQKPQNHLQEMGCRKCANYELHKNRKFTTKKFIEKSKKIHGNKFNYSKSNYINESTPVTIICKIHGKFNQSPYCHWSGCGCPVCKNISIRNKNRSNINKFIKKANKIHSYKYDYSKSVYINSHTNIKIICPKHGIFYQSPTNHFSGKGCKICSNRLSNTEEFIKKSNEIHKNLYDYKLTKYITCNKKVKIICKKHRIFFSSPSNHLKGRGCPKCKTNISKPEIEFLNYIKIKNQHISLNKWKRKTVDGFDPNTNIVYEFLGDYWHGNPVKYNKDNIHPICKKSFGELYENTFKTLNKVKSLGYDVKYIWESDWKRFKGGMDIQPKIQSL